MHEREQSVYKASFSCLVVSNLHTRETLLLCFVNYGSSKHNLTAVPENKALFCDPIKQQQHCMSGKMCNYYIKIKHTIPKNSWNLYWVGGRETHVCGGAPASPRVRSLTSQEGLWKNCVWNPQQSLSMYYHIWSRDRPIIWLSRRQLPLSPTSRTKTHSLQNIVCFRAPWCTYHSLNLPIWWFIRFQVQSLVLPTNTLLCLKPKRATANKKTS